jgi:uncharacterized protein YndB with AHSA1/START domain
VWIPAPARPLPDPSITQGFLQGLDRFAYELTFSLTAPPPRVWTSFVNDIDHWWTYRLRDRTRVVIEPEVGGRWMQVWDSGGALFGNFTVFDPPSLLCVTGPLAMTRPAFNWLEFIFEPTATGTKLTLRHQAIGEFDADTASIYENGWGELIGSAFQGYLARAL